jgi:outer membrane biosynthesis protein TonB
MKRTLHFAMTVLVSCYVFSFAQTTSPPTEQKQESPTSPAAPASQPPPTGSLKAVFDGGSITSGSAIAQASQAAQAAAKATAAMGPLVILTDTKGVDFGPYFQRVLHDVRMNWCNLIPESARAPLMKKGKLVIEFSILKDGMVTG